MSQITKWDNDTRFCLKRTMKTNYWKLDICILHPKNRLPQVVNNNPLSLSITSNIFRFDSSELHKREWERPSCLAYYKFLCTSSKDEDPKQSKNTKQIPTQDVIMNGKSRLQVLMEILQLEPTDIAVWPFMYILIQKNSII